MAGKNDYSDRQVLASCKARFLGQATPRKSIKYPDIIHEPLSSIYSSCTIKRQDLLAKTTIQVNICVYNSGILVTEQKRSDTPDNWYPIQNLYCSAAVKPDRGSKADTVVFRELREQTKSVARPLFTMVVRQPTNDGRRLLMCHAYLLENLADAQRLVDATKYAYQHKKGWNNPVADKEFLNAKLSYTLERLKVDEGTNLAELKIKSDERDKQLAKQPNPHPSGFRPTSGRRSQTTRSVVVQGTSATPRSMLVDAAPMPKRPVVIDRMMAQQSLRVPTAKAQSYYQGFDTETLSDDYGSASDVGFSRPSSGYRLASQPSPTMNHISNGFGHVTVTNAAHRRSHSSQPPRGHRILASSEPQDPSNGSAINGHVPSVVDWGSTVDEAPEITENDKPVAQSKKGKHSKHHRPSKRTMEKYLNHNGSSDDIGYNKDRRASQNSTESDSSYSIARMESQPSTSGINGFFSAHEHADQEL